MGEVGLQAVIKEDSSLSCGELAQQFNTSDEIVGLNMHHFCKTEEVNSSHADGNSYEATSGNLCVIVFSPLNEY